MAEVNILVTPEEIGQPEKIYFDKITTVGGEVKKVLSVDLTIPLPVELPECLSPDENAPDEEFVLYAEAVDVDGQMVNKPLGVQGEPIV